LIEGLNPDGTNTVATITGRVGGGKAVVEHLTLFLSQATPDAVRLPGSDRVVSALKADLTAATNRLGGPVTAKA
jgi:hypothetical protein